MNEEKRELVVNDRRHVAVDVPTPSGAATPMEMLDRALSSGASPDTLEKLMALQDKWSAGQARRAFDNAMADLRGLLKPIMKRQEGHTGKYEGLADISEMVDPLLSPLGLSYRWHVSDSDDKRIKVTCIVTHREGHREETALSALPDTTGSKNAIQAVGSAVTYLQRYTLKAALGLAAGKDTDANIETPDDYDTSEWTAKIAAADEARDKDKLLVIQKELKVKRSEIPDSSWKLLSSAFSAAMRRAEAAKHV